jgi:hypothetical protein
LRAARRAKIVPKTAATARARRSSCAEHRVPGCAERPRRREPPWTSR